MGALTSDDPVKGALSGAVSGALSEILAEMITQKPEEALQYAFEDTSNPNALADFLKNYESHVGVTTDIAHFLTAGIAAALNLDIQVANNVANNAVKNNFAPMIVAIAAVGGEVATAAALHYMRQVFLAAGAAGLSYLISQMPEEQRTSLIATWNKYVNTMDAAPDIDTADKGFTVHETEPQILYTPIAEQNPKEKVNATPVHEAAPQLEGFGAYDGPKMTILYNELKEIAGKVHVGSNQPVKKPNSLPAFPGAVRVKEKTPVQGGGGLRPRWEDKKYIYEWDKQHGTVEKYNKQGKHLGEFDHITGKELKPANPKRTVEK